MGQVSVYSEIGRLEGVIIHTPGQEVEKMTPESAERALYSDILNLAVACEEYSQFKNILSQYCAIYEVKELLTAILKKREVKQRLLSTICESEGTPELLEYLLSTGEEETARQLLEGVDIVRDNLTKYLNNERYSLAPLHNFFFTRDASISMFDKVLIGKMASSVRVRESVIMDFIFRFHPEFGVETLNPSNTVLTNLLPKVKIEGGDVLIISENVLVIGTGVRTSTQGIDYIIEAIKNSTKELTHIIVQELPESPESFIHLDMVFTILSQEYCMVYEPLLLSHNRFRTISIVIDNGSVKSIGTEPDLLSALQKLGYNFKPVRCGGWDKWNQEREQWHSGANFLALSPGVIIGYERNVHTMEELNKNGFDIVRASEITSGTKRLSQEKTVITIPGAELARGGGGARCMSMPVRRGKIEW